MFNKLPKAPKVRPSYQVGSVFDIPSGNYQLGTHGESILNSGITLVNSVSGPGNSSKSEIVLYFLITAMSRYGDSFGMLYDTENSMTYERLQRTANRFERLKGLDLSDPNNNKFMMTQSADILGDAYFDMIKDEAADRAKNINKLMIETPFNDVSNPGNPLKTVSPVFIVIDSLTEFKVSSVQTKLVDKNAVGESGANTQFMKEGAAKTQMITQLPNLGARAGLHFVQVAHIGDVIDMDPMAPRPNKLTFSKNGKKKKGVPEKFSFVNNVSYEIFDATFSKNSSSDKSAKYPKREADRLAENKDLLEITVVNTRNKSGPSGVMFTVFVSQAEGLLPNLTMFQYLVDHGDYGLEVNGNRTVMKSVFLPELNFGRTTVRETLDSNYKLCRAIEIACQMSQMEMLWDNLDKELHCSPAVLYEDLKNQGYDWDILLDTRAYWVFLKDEPYEKPFLSTMDLLRMRKGLYKPWWYSKMEKRKDKK